VPITSDAPRSFSFSYFANHGPASQVSGLVRPLPTGLVAIMHATKKALHHEIEEEEPEKQEPDNALDKSIRISDKMPCALVDKPDKPRLAMNNDSLAALGNEIMELKLALHDSQGAYFGKDNCLAAFEIQIIELELALHDSQGAQGARVWLDDFLAAFEIQTFKL